MLRKAADAGADVLAFDLEDAVAPGRKDEAREAVRTVLSDPSFDPDAEVCVRLNAGRAAATDLDAILGGGVRIDAVMLPKVGGADEVVRVGALLADRGRDLPAFALIETAAGVLRAEEIARAAPADALVFGAEDLAADLGATRTEEGTEVLYAREHVVIAARAAGIDAIDTVRADFEDAEGLESEAAFARTLGYDGKLAIHPEQVPIINAAFTPDPERVEWARRVLDAKAAADREDRGVFAVDGEMIDPPLIAQAERVLERAETDADRTS